MSAFVVLSLISKEIELVPAIVPMLFPSIPKL
jgi:hypothetical protein